MTVTLPDSETGWSVIVNVRDLLGSADRAPGEKPHWLRIRTTVVSGRRILAGR